MSHRYLFWRIIVVGVAIVLGISPSNPSGAARAVILEDDTMAQAGRIHVAPSPAPIQIGQRTTVEIWVDDVQDYYGIELRLRFNPQVVTVPSGNCTPLWEVFDASNHLLVRNRVDNSLGELSYVITNLNPAPSFSGSGRICALTFEGRANGISSVNFVYAKAADRDGNALWPRQGIWGMIWVGPVRQVWLPAIQ